MTIGTHRSAGMVVYITIRYDNNPPNNPKSPLNIISSYILSLLSQNPPVPSSEGSENSDSDSNGDGDNEGSENENDWFKSLESDIIYTYHVEKLPQTSYMDQEVLSSSSSLNILNTAGKGEGSENMDIRTIRTRNGVMLHYIQVYIYIYISLLRPLFVLRFLK